MMYALRTVGKPEALAPAVREAVARVDPRQPVTMLQPMEAYHSDNTRVSRSYMFLLTFFASMAVLLAAIGIYGAIAYAVSRRISEIGIRMALGARRRDVLKAAMSRELGRVAVGMLLGLILTVWLARLVFHQANVDGPDQKIISLYGVGVTDPVTLAIVTALLAAVAALASYLPARRAASIHPMDALRHE